MITDNFINNNNNICTTLHQLNSYILFIIIPIIDSEPHPYLELKVALQFSDRTLLCLFSLFLFSTTSYIIAPRLLIFLINLISHIILTLFHYSHLGLLTHPHLTSYHHITKPNKLILYYSINSNIIIINQLIN